MTGSAAMPDGLAYWRGAPSCPHSAPVMQQLMQPSIMEAPPASELIEVATEKQLMGRNGRLLVQTGGRHVALIAFGSDVHAIDATCYHMGGPLLHADIEDCGSFGPCIVCPWHRYKISLRTGDSLYQNMAGKQCSKGIKQRVHDVVRQDGKILVRLDPVEGKIESDTYAFKRPPPSGGGSATPPQRRSGDVLRAGAAGMRRPVPSGVAGDLAKSMCGADGRAPWARSSQPPLPPAKAGCMFGRLQAGASSTPSPLVATTAREDGWSRHVIRSRVEVGRRSVRLTLCGNLPRPTFAADWTCGAHAMVRLEGGEGGEERPYTPYQRAGGTFDGTFELVVKAYPEGALSPRLAALQPGDALLLRGPIYGAAALRPAPRPIRVRAIGFVAGGTGVTPMLQVIYSLLRSAARAQQSVQPSTPMSARASAAGVEAGAERSALPSLRLLCFNRQEEDILVADELAELSAVLPELRVFHSLSDPPAAWSGGRGRPSKEALQAQLPPPAPDVQLFWCGPPAFNSTVKQLLGELGYTDEMGHEFS